MTPDELADWLGSHTGLGDGGEEAAAHLRRLAKLERVLGQGTFELEHNLETGVWRAAAGLSSATGPNAIAAILALADAQLLEA